MHHVPRSVLTTLAAASALVAQRGLSATAGDPDAFRVPIHTQPGDYGIWAAGHDYKVSFHDGFVFYPVLGEEHPHNLPLSWRTTSVTAGEVEIAAGAGSVSWSDWRFERHYGAVTEVYDVRPDGVEQSFVLHALPAAGDVVVTGTIHTPLRAAPFESSCAPVQFHDANGTAVIRYGRAVAFDAAGRRTDVATSFDGQNIRMTLAETWLRDAVLPVTIDPLTSSAIVSSGGGRITWPDIARDDESNHVLVTYSRANAGTDHDAWARLLDDDLRAVGTVFADISASYSTPRTSAAFVGGANAWAIAHERVFSDAAAILVYLHPSGDATLNNGNSVLIAPPSGTSYQTPCIGGTPGNDGGGIACVVYRADVGTPPRNTESSVVRAALIDCVGRRVVRNVTLAGGTGIDAEAPSINRAHGGSTTAPWIAVWQQRAAVPGSPWEIHANQVHPDGALGQDKRLGSNVGDIHNLRPKIAGSAGRYLVAWVDRSNTGVYSGSYGRRLRVQRVDWPDGQLNGVSSTTRVLAEDSRDVFSLEEGRPLADDRNTDSHWALAWRVSGHGVEAARIGFDMRIAEQVTLAGDSPGTSVALAPAVCFDDDGNRFHFAYRVDGPVHAVLAISLLHPADAGAETFGARCGGRITARNRGTRNTPLAGSEFFGIDLAGGAPQAVTTLFAAPFAAPQPLALPLSDGCLFYLDVGAGLIDAASGSADAAGTFRFDLPIPSAAAGVDVFWQYVQIDASGVRASEALETRLR